MATWYEKHQRSRAAADAKQKAYGRNQVTKRHLRESSWESKSTVKITKADINRRIAKRKEDMFQRLQQRRYRLAQLLQGENDAYSRELENSIETDAQRRQRMMKRAETLQKEREASRRQEVERIRAEQFKDGLDEFRVLKSKAIKMQCHGGREEQVAARAKRAKAQEIEDMKIHKEYMQISQRMLEREIREAEELASKNDAMRAQVAIQAAEKRAIREAEEEEKQRDVEAWRRSLKEADAKEKAKQERIHNAKTANVKEMFRLNAINTKRLLEKERVLKEEEAKQLREALKAEQLSKEKEMAHTAERAAEAKRFQAFLKSRLAHQEDDESELIAVLAAENERAWAAREAVWDADKRQKEKLALEVANGMAEQVVRHRQDAIDLEAAKQKVKMDLREKNRLADEAEEEKQRKKQVVVDAYRGSLRTDIALKKKLREAEAAKVLVENREIAKANERFDANLKAVMGSSYMPPEHYRKKKVKWYF